MKPLLFLANHSSPPNGGRSRTTIQWSRSLASILFVCINLMLLSRAAAQSFTLLHGFSDTSTQNGMGTNLDGASPQASLIRSANMLYGTSAGGATGGNGSVFAISISGDFTNLYSFTSTSSGTNSDGARPFGPLVLYSNSLFGTTASGGSGGKGTIFELKPDGTGFVAIHNFSGDDGDSSWSGLTLVSNSLFGTASFGGAFGGGVVFKLDPDGSAFSVIYNFEGSITNTEGSNPYGSIILNDGVLYGTTAYGGTAGNGGIFAMAPDGSSFTNLHNFSHTTGVYTGTNVDGAHPFGRLVLMGKTLYGTAAFGGAYGHGTVFAVNTDGTGFLNLYSFNNADGAQPQAELSLLEGSLYGTTASGGKFLAGTVFTINPDGNGFATIYDFPVRSGAALFSGLVSLGNNLYGTASEGGPAGNGTLFKIALQPHLTIIPSGPNVNLTWPTNFTGFVLQSTSDVGPNVWTTNVLAPGVVNGRYTITTSISEQQKFFRLSEP